MARTDRNALMSLLSPGLSRLLLGSPRYVALVASSVGRGRLTHPQMSCSSQRLRPTAGPNDVHAGTPAMCTAIDPKNTTPMATYTCVNSIPRGSEHHFGIIQGAAKPIPMMDRPMHTPQRFDRNHQPNTNPDPMNQQPNASLHRLEMRAPIVLYGILVAWIPARAAPRRILIGL